MRFVGYVVLGMLAGVAGKSAVAQGDPAKAFDPATAAVRKPGTVVRVDLIGDSTQTDNAGYGRGFCANLGALVDCVNMAKGGASTKTFREDGIWDKALATKPDYMVIQFGHNDLVSKDHAARQVELPQYALNLKRMVTEARAAGIKPVLVTPLTRRYFKEDGKIHSDLGEYCEAMRAVAKEMNVPLIELQNESIAFFDKLGKPAADAMGISKKDNDGKTIPDATHLNWSGSYAIGRIVAVDLGKAVPALQQYVLPTAAALPPAGVKAMNVYRGGPVKIVLVGDSTTAPQGGWGPGFCAVMTKNVTCIDEALNGRSTKSFIDEGAWKKSLADKGDYYLIQFGHNDQKDDPTRHTDPETTFAANLRMFVHQVEAIGGVPVLLSPLARRTFKDGKPSNEDLRLYGNAARRVAAEEDITYIDLLSLSTAVLSRMTQEQADGFDAVAHADAKAENAGKAAPALDRTHLNPMGQKVFGRIVADNLVRTLVELGPDVVGVPASAASAVPTQAAPTDGH